MINGPMKKMNRRCFLLSSVGGVAGAALAHRVSALSADASGGTASRIREIAAVRYAPAGRYMKDHCFVRHDNRWHLFAPLGKVGTSWEDPGSEETAEHMVSDDWVTWKYLGTAASTR